MKTLTGAVANPTSPAVANLGPLWPGVVNHPPETEANWVPQTELGRKLKAIRERFLAAGGQVLTAEEIEAEVLRRRGQRD